MAAKCPACNKQLKIWHIKAECPFCGSNIPNHDWENRLEADAQRREADFFKMHTTLNMLKFSTVGSVPRIIRLVFSFLPVLGYVAPLAAFSVTGSDGTEIATNSLSAITLFTGDTLKLQNIIKLLTDGSHSADKTALAAFILFAASLLFGVVAFFLIPILFRKPKNPVISVFHSLSLISYCIAPVILTKAISAYGGTCSISWGIALGAVFFAAAIILDNIVMFKPVEEKDYKYIPKNDPLQLEYAIRTGAIDKTEII